MLTYNFSQGSAKSTKAKHGALVTKALTSSKAACSTLLHYQLMSLCINLVKGSDTCAKLHKEQGKKLTKPGYALTSDIFFGSSHSCTALTFSIAI